MHDLKATELITVVGGTKQNDLVTQQLTQLQTSIKDLTSNNTGSSSNSNTFMMLAMMMMMRPQPTVVAAGGPPGVPVAAVGGPVVNISTRVRHW